MKKIKALTLNIHKGFSSFNSEFVLKKLKDLLEKENPDVVFLQEIIGEHAVLSQKFSDWPKQTQFEFLADTLWSHFSYGKNAVYQKGNHGNAILSKFPIIFEENTVTSQWSFASRGILHAIAEDPTTGMRIHFFCVHFGLFDSERALQIEELIDLVNERVSTDEKLIIAGDFNDWRLKSQNTLLSSLPVDEAFLKTQSINPRTFPAWMPAFRVDRMYSYGLEIMSAKVMDSPEWKKVSDHLALCVEYRIS